MKFLHTADWHIGRKLHGKDLYEEQKHIIDKIIQQIDEHKVDAVIIAGDLYDRAIPSKEATTLLQSALEEINIKRKLPIFAISGNHDSRERLAVGQGWFSKNKFYLHTTLEQSFEKISYEDYNIYLLPYFEPYEAREYFSDDTLTTHHKATERVVNEIYKTMDETKINIIVAHTFVAGSVESDSEREISVGTVENVALSVFSKFDYVALGHLHNPNACKDEKIKYSGSPLAYSFGEAKQTKGTRLIQFENKKLKETFLPLEPLKKLHHVVSSYDDIMSENYKDKFDYKNDYFSMELSGLEGITDPMPKIQNIYPNTLVLKRKTKSKETENEKLEKVVKKSPLDLITNFYLEQYSEDLTVKQLDVIKKIIEGSE